MVDGQASLNQFKRTRRPGILPATPSGPKDDGFDDCDDDHMSPHDGPPSPNQNLPQQPRLIDLCQTHMNSQLGRSTLASQTIQPNNSSALTI